MQSCHTTSPPDSYIPLLHLRSCSDQLYHLRLCSSFDLVLQSQDASDPDQCKHISSGTFSVSFTGTSKNSLWVAAHRVINLLVPWKADAPMAVLTAPSVVFHIPAALLCMASRSELNWVNTSISRYCARSIRILPAAFFIALVCAAPPTRDTDKTNIDCRTHTCDRTGHSPGKSDHL